MGNERRSTMRYVLAVSAAVLGLPAAAGTLAPRPAFAEGLQVAPMIVTIAPKSKTAAVTVFNDRATASVFEVKAFAWSREAARDQLTPTHELIVVPPVLSVASRETRILRIGVAVEPSERERAYRIVLREILPAAQFADRFIGARIAVAVSMPIFVSPAAQATRDLVWSARMSAKRRLELTVANRGTVHVAISRIRLFSNFAPSASSRPIGEKQASEYVLAGETRTFTLDVDRPNNPAVTIEITDKADESKITRTTVDLQ